MSVAKLRRKGLFVGLLALSACASLPQEEQTENLITPPSVETSVRDSLESGFFVLSDWPKQAWWEVFQSTELNALIAEALVKDPTIQSVERRVEMARQTAKVVRSNLFPLLFFDADETWEYLSHNGLYRALNPSIPINANLVDLTLSSQYEFDFWGKNRNLFRAALGEEKAREAEAAGVSLIVSSSVAQAYFALKTNLARYDVYRELYEVRQALLELQKLLQRKSLLSRLQPLLSEESLLEASKHIYGIEQEIKTDRHLINILLGRDPDTPLEIHEGGLCALTSLNIPDTLSMDLLARRPDLMAQIWRVESLAHEVGAAKADFYPNVNLKAFIGLESIAYRLLFNTSSKIAGLQPAIHLPIFTAGAIRANLRAKKALFDAAVFDYNALLLRSSGEVADLLVLAQSLFEQLDDQKKIVEAAQNRCDLTTLRQRSGLDNRLTSYVIQEELLLKKLDALTLRYNQYLVAVKLIKALGGGYESAYTVPLRGKSS